MKSKKGSKKGMGKMSSGHETPGKKVYQQNNSDTPVMGGNLKFPKTSQAVHVANVKDNMAHNVGGSAAHQMVDSKSMGHQPLIETGAAMKKPASKTEKY